MKKQILFFSFLVFFLIQTVSVRALIIPMNEKNIPAVVVSESVNQFNHLSKKEKKSRISEVKAQLKLFKANQREGKANDERTILLVILAILLPPLAVYLYENAITNKFWISLILTLLLWVPGVIYSILVVLGVV